MAKQMDSRDLSNVERDLTDLFSAVAVDTAFTAALERRLKAAQAGAVQAEVDNTRPRRLGGLRRLMTRWVTQRRWAVAALGVLLIVMLTVTLIGPQQVWAGFQRLLRDYVPGLGFISLEQAWMLEEPVEVTRDGVVLRVEHLVASPERTVVHIETTGLNQRLGPSLQAESALRTYEQAYDAFEAFLRLPDGTRLAVVTKSLRVGGGVLAFPPLPTGVDASELVLEIPRLPLLPAGVAPEDWAIPLSLSTATDRPATDHPQVKVYALSDAEDTHVGITLGVLEVAHSPVETAVHVRATWDPEMGQVWIPALPVGGAVTLRDEETVYQVQDLHTGSPVQWGNDAHALFGAPGRLDLGRGRVDLGTAARSSVEDMWVFDPLHGVPHSLTLQVDWFYVYLPATGMSFTVDLGDDPQDGNQWPLDVHLAVGDDMALHVASVRLTGLSASEAQSCPDAAWKLSFEILPEEPDDRFLESVMVMSPLNSLGGGAESRRWTSKPGAGWALDEGPILSWMFVQTLPEGPIDVQVSSASVRVQGPWTVTWRIPEDTGYPADAGYPNADE